MNKKLFTASLILFLSASAFMAINSILERIGLEEKAAKEHVMGNVLGSFWGSFSEGAPDHFQLPRAKLLPSIITGDKVGAAKELCTWVRDYTRSDEFREAYAKRRQDLKPPMENESRPDEETIEMTRSSVQQMEKQLAEMKKYKGTPPDAIKAVQMTVDGMKKNLAQWSDPAPKNTAWEKRYPADARELVRRRLEEYLTLAATVDFNAALETDRYNRKKFVNPEYEKKSNQWKAVYRAGKEVNDVVIVFVKDWLKSDFSAAAAPAKPANAAKPAAPKSTKPATQARGRNPRTGK